MNQSARRSRWLLEHFASFYKEVALIKEAIAHSQLPAYLAVGDKSVSTNAKDLAATVSFRLRNLLAVQAKIVRSSGTEVEIAAYESAQYVMASLADEIFILEETWDGQKHFHEYLLERGLFRTASAGKTVFTRLDDLLKSRAKDTVTEDLASVYLMALQLGFKGRYRGESNSDTLNNYRSDLLQFIGIDGEATFKQRVFNQAYKYAIADNQGHRLAPLSRWYLLLGVGAVVYVGISSVIWVLSVAKLNEILGG